MIWGRGVWKGVVTFIPPPPFPLLSLPFPFFLLGDADMPCSYMPATTCIYFELLKLKHASSSNHKMERKMMQADGGT